MLKPFTKAHGWPMVPGYRNARPTSHFHYASWVFHPPTRALARLLGPCFKTGRWTGFGWYPVRAAPLQAGGGAADRPRHARPQGPTPQRGVVRPRAPVPASAQCRQQLGRAASTRAHAAGPSLPTTQFHALFYSLASGLFIVPSRYFFAIGLPLVFSLRWGLPPNWGCIPKQPDSPKASREGVGGWPTGLSPSRAIPSSILRPRPSRECFSRLQFASRRLEIYMLGSSLFARRY